MNNSGNDYTVEHDGMVYKGNESIFDVVEYMDPKKYPEYYI
jgi:hypothetical protein